MTEQAQQLASLAPSERDFEAIEAAVMETQRGRWFLDEFKRRNRHADTLVILTMLERLERSVKREKATPDFDRIRFDLAEMADAIERTKQEIAEIKTQTDDGNRFVQASNELDAIVTQTETATGDILGAAEKIQELAWTLREEGASSEVCDQLDEHATNIYMACSFQDLTGQRTRKVVQVLKYLENRVHAMIDIWGLEEVDAAPRATPTAGANPHDSRPDAHLLNGPQLAGRGVSQSAVDDLFDPPTEAVSTSDPVVIEAIEVEQAAATHMSSEDVDALFDRVEPDVIADDAEADEALAEFNAARSIVDDIEIVNADVSDPVEEFAAAQAPRDLEADLVIEVAGEPATAPIPDEPEELVTHADVFAPALPNEPMGMPAVADPDVVADVFAPSVDGSQPTTDDADTFAPVVTLVAVGSTLRVAEVAAVAIASPAPLMAVEAAADPLRALTPVMRLNLMG